jgi:hypothetical protein
MESAWICAGEGSCGSGWEFIVELGSKNKKSGIYSRLLWTALIYVYVIEILLTQERCKQVIVLFLSLHCYPPLVISSFPSPLRMDLS